MSSGKAKRGLQSVCGGSDNRCHFDLAFCTKSKISRYYGELREENAGSTSVLGVHEGEATGNQCQANSTRGGLLRGTAASVPAWAAEDQAGPGRKLAVLGQAIFGKIVLRSRLTTAVRPVPKRADLPHKAHQMSARENSQLKILLSRSDLVADDSRDLTETVERPVGDGHVLETTNTRKRQ